MIRFIDLRNQGTGYRFAFFDTVSDRFLDFGGEHAWDSVKDFTEVYTKNSHGYDVDRLVRQLPEWALSEPKDDAGESSRPESVQEAIVESTMRSLRPRP